MAAVLVLISPRSPGPGPPPGCWQRSVRPPAPCSSPAASYRARPPAAGLRGKGERSGGAGLSRARLSISMAGLGGPRMAMLHSSSARSWQLVRPERGSPSQFMAAARSAAGERLRCAGAVTLAVHRENHRSDESIGTTFQISTMCNVHFQKYCWIFKNTYHAEEQGTYHFIQGSVAVAAVRSNWSCTDRENCVYCRAREGRGAPLESFLSLAVNLRRNRKKNC